MNKVKKTIYKGIAAFYAVLFFTISLGTAPVLASDPNQDSEVSEEGRHTDYSFYSMSSVVANTVNDCFVKGVKITDVMGTPNRGNAGGLLGFPDRNLGNNAVGYFYTNASKSEVTVAYQQIASMKDSDVGEALAYADVYAAFGAVMHDAGCDETDFGSSITMGNAVAGGILYVVYNMSRVVTKVFVGVLLALKVLNPFGFFNNLDKFAYDGTTVNANITKTTNSLFSTDLLKSMADLFVAAEKLGLVMAVIFFAMILLFFFLNKTVFVTRANKPFEHGSMFKKWAIRLLFLFFGIPILGFAYTTALNGLIKTFTHNVTDMNAARVVQSILCDFKGFAINQDNIDDSFKLAGDVPFKVDDDYNVTYGGASIMRLCATINKSAHPDYATSDTINSVTATDVIKTLQKPLSDTSGLKEDYTANLITMYMTGAQFSAADYNGLWVSKHWAKDLDETKKDRIAGIIDSYATVQIMTNPDYTNEKLGPGVKPYGNRFSEFTGGVGGGTSGLNPMAGGSAGMTFGSMGAAGDALIKSSGSTKSIPMGFQLSPLAIFNFLNTSFGKNAMTITSSTQSQSSASRIAHNSVNLVGTGIGSFINYLLCISMIFTELVVGIFYAFSMLFGNLKRGFRMIIAVPGAFLGSIPAIARVISYTIMMILEVVCTVMLYAFACEIIYSIGIFFSSDILTTIVSAGAVAASALAGLMSPMQIIISLFLIVMYVWLIIMLIRMRKPIIKAMDGIADNIINSFMMTVQNSSPMGAAVTKGMANLSNPSARKGLAGKAENKVNKSLASTFGGGAAGGSAMNDEYITDAELKGKREAAKARTKAIATGTVQAAMGTAAVVAGAYTGNPGLMASGVKNMGKGTVNVANSGKNSEAIKSTYSQNATKAVMAENEGKVGVKNDVETGLDQYGKNVQSQLTANSVNSIAGSVSDTANGYVMGAGGAGGVGGEAVMGGAEGLASSGGVESVASSMGGESVASVVGGSGSSGQIVDMAASSGGGTGGQIADAIGGNGGSLPNLQGGKKKISGQSYEISDPALNLNGGGSAPKNVSMDVPVNADINFVPQGGHIGANGLGNLAPNGNLGTVSQQLTGTIMQTTKLNTLKSKAGSMMDVNNQNAQRMFNGLNGNQSASAQQMFNGNVDSSMNISQGASAMNIAMGERGLGANGLLNKMGGPTSMHVDQHIDGVVNETMDIRRGATTINDMRGDMNAAIPTGRGAGSAVNTNMVTEQVVTNIQQDPVSDGGLQGGINNAVHKGSGKK